MKKEKELMFTGFPHRSTTDLAADTPYRNEHPMTSTKT
jgi:hypothetical protein